MRFAAIRDAILDKEQSNLDRDAKKKLLPYSVIQAKSKGLELCRKVKSLKALDALISARQRGEEDVAKKGDVDAYWDYRYATVEARKVMALLEGAVNTKAKVGKRAAKELASAMGDEQ